MKIAIIAPSPVPFAIGGAENLWAGLLHSLNERPGVEADLIKLPTPERNLIEILQSYIQFAELDVKHFDLVITTKYPAWAIRHPHHRVFMQHKLRGLYDTYPNELPTELSAQELLHAKIQAPIREALLGGSIAELEVTPVAEHLLGACLAEGFPDHLLNFPGPFSRACVHLLDRIALQPGRIEFYSAISKTVAKRHSYFPDNTKVEIIYHPTFLQNIRPGPAKTIFSTSRLDAAKRIDLIIKGYLASDVPFPLRIAGTGPDEERLKALANNHPNIHFLGRITSAELIREYSEAIFVPFVPFDEDYGLITLEAMLASKPVLTAKDSGGTTELVRHGKNGLIVPPTPEAIAKGMRLLCSDLKKVASWGEFAKEEVSNITWDALLDRLLEPRNDSCPLICDPKLYNRERPRIVVINTFQLEPLTSGGQLRLYNLYRHLALRIDVHFVNLAGRDTPYSVRIISPGCIEEIVPMSSEFVAAEYKLSEQVGASAGDLAAALYPDLLPQWISAIKKAVEGCVAIVCSHPYGFPALVHAGYSAPMIYESHNVEYDLKNTILRDSAWAIEEVRKLESACLHAARIVTACSLEDIERLRSLYQRQELVSEVIPNGVDFDSIPFTNPEERNRKRARLKFTRPLALFMGSAHDPNRIAVEKIIEIALTLPEVDFVIVGSVSVFFENVTVPDNVRFLGVISTREKEVWLGVANFGINPIFSGSGTNLKIAEYAAAGILVLSTSFGARGGIFHPGRNYIALTPPNLQSAFLTALSLTDHENNTLISNAYDDVKKYSDWKSISGDYLAIIRTLDNFPLVK